MNQQVQDLIEKGNMEGVADMVDCEMGEEGLGTKLLAGFTELIVKECMDAVGDHQMDLPAIQRIKRRFGVEYYEPIEKAFE